MKKVIFMLTGLLGIGGAAMAQDASSARMPETGNTGSDALTSVISKTPDAAGDSLLAFNAQPRRRVYRSGGYSNNRPSRSFGSDRGYLGINVGAAFPVGSYNDYYGGGAKTGFHANLLNVGYLFAPSVGISGDFFYGQNSNKIVDGHWSYIGATAGLLFTIPLSPMVSWDIKPQIGIASFSTPDPSDVVSNSYTAFTTKIGTQFRFNLNRDVAFTVNLDYLHAQPQYNYVNAQTDPDGSVWYGYKQNINNIVFGGGLVYRLR